MDKNAFYQQAAGQIQAGNLDAAESMLTAFLAQHRDDEIATSILGSLHMRAGRFDEGLDLFRQNTATHPGSFAAWADLGFASRKADDSAAALDAFVRAVKINPGLYPAWTSLEGLYYEAGRFSEAIDAHEKCEQLDPLDQMYQNLMRSMQSGQKGEAEHIARQMLGQQPGHPRAAFFLAHLAETLGAHEQRAEILRHGLEFHPANPMLRRSLIEALEAIGLYEEALAEAKDLVSLLPDFTAFWLLSRIEGHAANYDASLKAAESAAALLEDGNQDLGKVDLLRGHALKILGRRKESEEAYRACIVNTPDNGAGWWGLADLKTYKFSETDRERMEALVENLSLDADQRCQAAFALARAYENDGETEAAMSWYLRGNALRPDADFDPVEHDQFHLRLKQAFDTQGLATQALQAPEGPCPIFILGMPRAGSTLLEQILASHSQVEGTMELMTLAHLERRIRIEGGSRFDCNFPESMPRFSTEDLQRFGQTYMDESAIYRTDTPYFIDKMPPNFERIGLIHKILPQAIIIDARRHPMDCGYSAFKQHFASGHPYSYDLAHIGAYYNAYLDLMDHWDEVLPGKVCHVQYEAMIDDPEAMIRKVLDHIGLPFEEACLRFHENKRAVKTASSEQVRQPLNRKGIGVWRKVEDQLEPLRIALGEETLARF